jgi:hypothetical protein
VRLESPRLAGPVNNLNSEKYSAATPEHSLTRSPVRRDFRSFVERSRPPQQHQPPSLSEDPRAARNCHTSTHPLPSQKHQLPRHDTHLLTHIRPASSTESTEFPPLNKTPKYPPVFAVTRLIAAVGPTAVRCYPVCALSRLTLITLQPCDLLPSSSDLLLPGPILLPLFRLGTPLALRLDNTTHGSYHSLSAPPLATTRRVASSASYFLFETRLVNYIPSLCRGEVTVLACSVSQRQRSLCSNSP